MAENDDMAYTSKDNSQNADLLQVDRDKKNVEA